MLPGVSNVLTRAVVASCVAGIALWGVVHDRHLLEFSREMNVAAQPAARSVLAHHETLEFPIRERRSQVIVFCSAPL